MQRSICPCQKAPVPVRAPARPPLRRATAALLAGLLALAPAAQPAPARTSVVVLPHAAFPGVPESAAQRAGELLSQEVRRRGELKLVVPKPRPPAARGADAVAQARLALGKAAELATRGRHAPAAAALEKAISLLASKPAALDEEGGKLLVNAALQLAVERLVSGDEDGGESALAQLVRLAPEREVRSADYPPAFLVELAGVRKRLLATPRGSLRVLAPPGSGETRVFVDGRPVHGAPVVVKDLIPGEHFVRVERAGATWGQKLVAIAGVETRVAPQPGAEGPAAELTGALLLGEVDRASVQTAGRLARAAGAQAALFGALLKSGDGFTLRSFLCLAKADRLVPLAPVSLDAELLGGLVQMVKLGDDAVAKLSVPPPEPLLPLSLESAAPPALAEVHAAPPPPLEAEAAAIPLAPLVPAPQPTPAAAAPAPPVPGAPVPTSPPATAPAPTPAPAAPAIARAASDPPSRALVIPRMPTPDDADALQPARAVQQLPAQKRLEALEPDAIKTVREPPASKSHTLLWVVVGALVAGGLATGGYFLYQSTRSPESATVTTTWTH
jgi:hypothetical protein